MLDLYKKIAIGIIFIGLLILSCYIVPQLDKAVLDILFVSGTLASLFGLLVLFIQVSAIKNISQVTKETTEKTKEGILSFLSASDISKTIKLVQEIQVFNRSNKYELSFLRMQDLKYDLSQIKNNDGFKPLIKKSIYLNHLLDLSIYINSVEKELKFKSESLDTVKLNSFLEKISSDLVDLDTKIKQSGGVI